MRRAHGSGPQRAFAGPRTGPAVPSRRPVFCAALSSSVGRSPPTSAVYQKEKKTVMPRFFAVALLAASHVAAPPSQVHLSLDPHAGGTADWAPVVGWRSPSGTGAFVQLGSSPNNLRRTVAAEAYTTHPGMGGATFAFATLRGLAPDTSYWYRVGSPATGFSAVHNLTAPPVSGAKPTPPWNFLAYGDLGIAPTTHEDKLGQDVRCSSNGTVNADPPGCPDVTLRQLRQNEWDGARLGLRHELVLHVGDIVYADYGCNLSTNVQWWDSFATSVQFMAASKPYLICPGNHDLHGRSGPNVEPGGSSDLESTRYNGRFRMPSRVPVPAGGNTTPTSGPERYYYAYTHRNVRFVSISTEHSLSPGSEQYTWLEAELAAADSPAARAKQPWLLLFGHKPPVCSHAEVCGEAAVPLGLLAKHHVDLALWGHLHAYERTLPMVNTSLAATGGSYHNAHGTPHVVIGMAGDGFCCGGWSALPPHWSAHREDSFGYARLHVESDASLRFEYVRNGDGGPVLAGVRDNFTITKDAVGGGGGSSSSIVWRPTTRRTDEQHEDLLPPLSDLGHRVHLGSCPEDPEDARRP